MVRPPDVMTRRPDVMTRPPYVMILTPLTEGRLRTDPAWTGGCPSLTS